MHAWGVEDTRGACVHMYACGRACVHACMHALRCGCRTWLLLLFLMLNRQSRLRGHGVLCGCAVGGARGWHAERWRAGG